VIRLGDEAAVVVPLEEYRRLRELERRAELVEQADADEARRWPSTVHSRRRTP